MSNIMSLRHIPGFDVGPIQMALLQNNPLYWVELIDNERYHRSIVKLSHRMLALYGIFFPNNKEPTFKEQLKDMWERINGSKIYYEYDGEKKPSMKELELYRMDIIHWTLLAMIDLNLKDYEDRIIFYLYPDLTKNHEYRSIYALLIHLGLSTHIPCMSNDILMYTMPEIFLKHLNEELSKTLQCDDDVMVFIATLDLKLLPFILYLRPNSEYYYAILDTLWRIFKRIDTHHNRIDARWYYRIFYREANEHDSLMYHKKSLLELLRYIKEKFTSPI